MAKVLKQKGTIRGFRIQDGAGEVKVKTKRKKITIGTFHFTTKEKSVTPIRGKISGKHLYRAYRVKETV